MKRIYTIEWYDKRDVKYGKTPTTRTNIITLGKPTGRTELDAKAALDIFTKSFGNLRKNEVVRIKEFDENGQIGEDIVPSTEENAIIPTGRIV